MLKRPSDLEVLFRFATIATKAGDYWGAISTLERMLLVGSFTLNGDGYDANGIFAGKKG